MKPSPLLVASFALLVAGCAATPAVSASRSTASPSPTAQEYAVSALVLENRLHGPQLCYAVGASLPPMCGGPDVVGWDWDAVEGEESLHGTTWGDYRVVGTFDGERLILTEPPGQPRDGEPGAGSPGPGFSTRCPTPDGGWTIEDPATATLDGREAALKYANEQPDLGSIWLDIQAHLADVLPGVPEQAVLNATFTGDVERHERQLRARYGGPLCVSRAARSQEELTEVQQRVHQVLGGNFQYSGADGVRSVVKVMVPVVDDELRARVAEVDPDGLVVLSSWLQPVE